MTLVLISPDEFEARKETIAIKSDVDVKHDVDIIFSRSQRVIVLHCGKVIEENRDKGMTILMADQNLKFCRQVCKRGYILEKGRMVHTDTMEGIMADDTVIGKYLAL